MLGGLSAGEGAAAETQDHEGCGGKLGRATGAKQAVLPAAEISLSKLKAALTR